MRYPGGKGGCYHHIINTMPPHKVYIETHLGGGNVFESKKPAMSTIGIDVDAAVIARWRSRIDIDIPGLTLINGDAGSEIAKMSLKGDELIYADPPYLLSTRKSGKMYDYEYTTEQHVELLDLLKVVNCMVVLSGYKSDLYMDMLAGWSYKEFQAQTRGGMATESVWFNYKPPGKLHDSRYIGSNFREREKVKRMRARWLRRFKALPLAVQYVIYEGLTDHIVGNDDESGLITINDDMIKKEARHV